MPRVTLTRLGKEDITLVELGDQTAGTMTVLYSDIRGFTGLSETLAPVETFALVNRHFGATAPLVRLHGGLVDKYLGNAVMAIFPKAPEDAVRAASAMAQTIRQRANRALADHRTSLACGIGVHSGALILGTVGEANRMDTTVISDAVNVASRLEGLTKHYGVAAIISGSVEAKLPPELKADCLYLDRISVKSRQAEGIRPDSW